MVSIEGKTVGKIGKGLCVFLGVAQDDTEKDREVLFHKLIHLRIFSDQNGKMNINLFDYGGSLLLVSQFTLLADCRKGLRPSFLEAGDPKQAKTMYESCITYCKELGIPTEHGVFGADMQVKLCNDGPVTICLNSKELMS